MNYTVYILYAEKHDKIYIGFTSNLIQRFKSHQQSGKDWTSRYRPWTIIYCRFVPEKSEALLCEKKLKQYRQRLKIRSLIQQQLHATGFIQFQDEG